MDDSKHAKNSELTWGDIEDMQERGEPLPPEVTRSLAEAGASITKYMQTIFLDAFGDTFKKLAERRAAIEKELADVGLNSHDIGDWSIGEVRRAIDLAKELRDRFGATVTFPRTTTPRRRGPKPKMTMSKVERMQELWKQGKTPLQIANALEVSDRTIQRAIKNLA